MRFSWKRCAVGLAVAVACVVTPLVAANPAGAVAPAAGTMGIQIEAVSSVTPVVVSDVADIEPQSTTATYYCAVRDNTFNCQPGTPGDGLVVSILYQQPSFNENANGWRVVIYNPAYQVGCSGGTSDNEGGANLGPTLSNNVSSVRTYNTCDVKLFDGDNATGAATGWLNLASSLGTMDNRANSFKIS